ncbi:MAG TPA: DUF4412 domain-containing protein [Myxococcota bacterium]
MNIVRLRRVVGRVVAGTAIGAAVVAVAGCDLLPKGPFEGELRFRFDDARGARSPVVVGDDAPGDIDLAIKGPAVRAWLTGAPRQWGLLRFDQRAASVVDDDTKTAMELTMDDVDKALGHTGLQKLIATETTPSSSPPPVVEKTGDDDTVAGRDCDVWLVRFDTGERAELCVARLGKMPWSDAVAAQGVAGVVGADRFPLRVVMRDVAGTVASRLEVVRIDEHALDDARFIIPSTYTTVSLGGLVREAGAAFGAFIDKITPPAKSSQPLNAPSSSTTAAGSTGSTGSDVDYGQLFDRVADEVGAVVGKMQQAAEQAAVDAGANPRSGARTPGVDADIDRMVDAAKKLAAEEEKKQAAMPTPTSTPPPSVTTGSNADVARVLAGLSCQIAEHDGAVHGIVCLNAPATLSCSDVLLAAKGATFAKRATVQLLSTTKAGDYAVATSAGSFVHTCTGTFEPQSRRRTGPLPKSP